MIYWRAVVFPLSITWSPTPSICSSRRLSERAFGPEESQQSNSPAYHRSVAWGGNAVTGGSPALERCTLCRAELRTCWSQIHQRRGDRYDSCSARSGCCAWLLAKRRLGCRPKRGGGGGKNVRKHPVKLERLFKLREANIIRGFVILHWLQNLRKEVRYENVYIKGKLVPKS